MDYQHFTRHKRGLCPQIISSLLKFACVRVLQIIRRIVFFVLYLGLFLSMTLFSGINNLDFNHFTDVKFNELTSEVRVYRDEFGVPTIIGNNLKDIVFVQGYELARDRAWQLEFYRSLINGELSRLFGKDLLETDIFLRTVGLKRVAEQMITKINPEQLELIESYVSGINKFYQSHEHNQPFEMQILRKNLKAWKVADTVAMASIVAFTFAFGGLINEVIRMETLQKVGPEKTLELFPVDFPPAREFMQKLNNSDILPKEDDSLQILKSYIKPLVSDVSNELLMGFQSNNWVVSGNKTKSGKPLLSNDPHTNLEAQGIWHRVNLFSNDGSIFLQGFTFPGIPLLAFGHNQHMAWGVTSGILDTVDLFYLTENGTHYLINNTIWKPFETIATEIKVSGGDTVEEVIRISDYGPMVDTDLGEFAMMWTLHQNYERDNPIESLFEFNFASNPTEFHNALEKMLTGFNWVYATLEGDIGYQNTGFIPIRKNGFGLIPMNGSNGKNGWEGLVPYDQQLWVQNPTEGYFATANERVDTRELFYISEVYAHRYRNDRIEQVLENATDFNANPLQFTIEDMQQLQQDVKTLVADDLLEPIEPILQSAQFSNLNSELVENVIDDLIDWDHRMEIDSISALVFATFRNFLVDEVVRDEIGDIADIYSYSGIRTLSEWLINDSFSDWFDDKSTIPIETKDEIVIKAFSRTLEYLINRFGDNLDHWKWGDKHRVVLPHVFDVITPRFNIGGKPAGGSSLTVNAIAGPLWDEGEIIYTSSYGPYFRWVIEVNPEWDSVYGMVSSGASQNPFSPHYDDAYDGWISYDYQLWHNDPEYIKENYKLTAIFRRK